LKLLVWLQQAWNAPPRGYAPGVTLARVAHDLNGLRARALSPERWRFDQSGASWHFDVLERVQPQFLMHVVSSRFIMPVPGSEAGDARIALTHTGAWRRSGLNWRIKRGERTRLQPLLARLDADEMLREALMALDFHVFELAQDENGWRVETEPYGASEVVVRFPAMRRYIRLTRDHAQHLVNALARLQGKLRPLPGNTAATG